MRAAHIAAQSIRSLLLIPMHGMSVDDVSSVVASHVDLAAAAVCMRAWIVVVALALLCQCVELHHDMQIVVQFAALTQQLLA